MTTTKEIDETKFEKMLLWLDTDREAAGRKYESIRRRLIYIFRGRRCFSPEDLADETIDRVTQKIEKLADSYQGDPAPYFFSVARHILQEYFRRPQTEKLSEFLAQEVNSHQPEEKSNCLVVCLQTLTDENRQLFIEYHQTNINNHIKQRKLLAQKLDISEGYLRKKVFRIKGILQKCVLNCLAKKKG
jgi:RNA polymerase sigma factor (sigma-70 family)